MINSNSIKDGKHKTVKFNVLKTVSKQMMQSKCAKDSKQRDNFQSYQKRMKIPQGMKLWQKQE